MRELEYEETVAAPARHLFDLVADVVAAPQYVATHLHAEIVRTQSPERDLVARWVIDGGAARGWRLWRTRDTGGLVITFEHETPKPPLSGMRGEWRFEEQPDGGTRVRVRHAFDLAPGTDPSAAAKVAELLDGNVPRQVAEFAELAGRIGTLRRNTVVSDRAVRSAVPRGELAACAAGAVADDARWARVEPAEGRLVFKRHTGLEPELHSSTGEFRLVPEDGGTTVRLRRAVTLAGPASEERRRAARARLDAEVREQLADLARTGVAAVTP
ncbi:SRPBCC family protein [Streptomyces boncukensis]|uniref:Coenzyme Q-binding protein COQ10 START domain-containing protein n=1 Tax=Streptomyces boncukensis TaxID=2711219 RepID=A0A6G4X255_9ACTN|nr:SRPBCC family protein [Streptomyces boncukensis]NGO71626.1 hypothetical protein [Streptomyces boncukensis]